MTHDDLIAALEKATGPNRELDVAIWEAVDPAIVRRVRQDARALSPKGSSDADLARAERSRLAKMATAYTASLDAAMTLIPHVEPRTHWHLQAYPHGCYSATVSDTYPVGTHYGGQHMTSPALALCIAAMKART